MKKSLYLFVLIAAFILDSTQTDAQYMQFINYPADTVGWVYGSSQTASNRRAKYTNDTFVVTTGTHSQNNYLYSNIPVTLFGAGSSFNASFDFRMDSSSACSDGLTFWFFTAGFSDLGCTCHEGHELGFPDTTKGFALAMKTTGCVNKIFLRKINSNSYSFHDGTTSTISDSNLCTPLASQMWLTDSAWHHCEVSYLYGNITVTYDGGAVVLTGYSPISGTGHFGFMGTNGGGYTRKSLKNIQISTSLGTPTDSTDSFGVYVNKLCNGPQIIVQTENYLSTHHIRTWYGDGTSDDFSTSPTATGGFVALNHTYLSPAIYNIKQVLYNGIMPLDSLTLSYDNIFCSTLPVKFYFEMNGNCTKDATEAFITAPVKVSVDSNGVPVDTLCATSGFYYKTSAPPGTVYRFGVISMPGNFYTSCPASGFLYDTVAAGIFSAPVKNIGFSCGTGSTFDLSINAVIPVTGVRDQWGDIYVRNTSCMPIDAEVTLHFSPKYIFTGNANPAPSYSVGNTLKWNVMGLSGLATTPVKIHYQVDEPASGPLTIGDSVRSTFIISPISGDGNPSNNQQDDVDTVRAGCDPNAIEVLPLNCFENDTQFKFTIHFENTGNDTAHNIYLLDTLSDFLNPSSMEIVMASAEMYVTKLKYGAGHNIVRFDFPNIKLLDSSHHGECDGMVIYTIKNYPSMTYGATISSRAGIYFDVNEVVMTNTVQNQKGCPPPTGFTVKAGKGKMLLYPNPTNDELTIETEQGIYTSLIVSNAIGQQMISRDMGGTTTRINVKALPAGVYYLMLKGVQGNEVRKFVKW